MLYRYDPLSNIWVTVDEPEPEDKSDFAKCYRKAHKIYTTNGVTRVDFHMYKTHYRFAIGEWYDD